jgi:acyl-coenzyme A synthetase/AMP-(fatty) acid ligase
VAAVVLKSGKTVDSASIQHHMRQTLATYKCPTKIYFVEQIPKSAVGKVLRKDLKIKYSNQEESTP